MDEKPPKFDEETKKKTDYLCFIYYFVEGEKSLKSY